MFYYVLVISAVIITIIFFLIILNNILKKKQNLLKTAKELYLKRRYRDAIKVIEIILKNDNSLSTLYYYIYADCLLNIDSLNNAKQILENLYYKKEEIEIPLIDLSEKLIEVYKKTDDTEKLLYFLNDIIMQMPDNYKNYYELAEVYIKRKQYDAALIYYNKSNKINSNADVLLKIAKCHYLLNNSDESLKILNKVIRLYPNTYKAYYQISRIYYEQKKYLEVVEFADKGIKISTGKVKYKIILLLVKTFIETEEIQLALENILFAFRDLDKKKYLEQYLELKYLQGKVYKNLDNTKLAQKCFKEIEKIDSNYRDVNNLIINRKITDVISYIKNIKKTELDLLMQDIANYFNLKLEKYDYIPNEDIKIICKSKQNKSTKSIIILKLLNQSASDWIFEDFKAYVESKKYDKGILLLPGGLTKNAEQKIKLYKNIKTYGKLETLKLFQSFK